MGRLKFIRLGTKRLQVGTIIVIATRFFINSIKFFYYSRIFCGDLGNEVTDDILARVFNKYSSFLRARVVRDRNSKKSKG